jgi:hypothetical protein
MKAKEFVKRRIPKATAEKQVSGFINGLQKTYWLIRERGNSMYLAEGFDENNAWSNAKKLILEREEKYKNDISQRNRIQD